MSNRAKKFTFTSKYFGALFTAVTLILACVPAGVSATVTKADYTGAIMVRSAETITMKPNEKVTFRLTVKNTGTVSWTNSGTRFVSVYTYFPKYRTSVFRDTTWYRSDQPAKLTEAKVKPGEIGHIEFVLKAPAKEGSYEEGFYMAAEDFAWITGTQFKIPITVTTKVAVKPAPVVTPVPTVPLAASVMIKSFSDRVTMRGGDIADVTVGFKNTGTATWQTRILRVRSAALPSSASFAAPNWPNALEPLRIREPIEPGMIAFFTFPIQASLTRGDYTLPLKLVIDDVDVPGTDFDVPVTVTEDAPQLPVQEIPIVYGGVEPMVRVGLWKPTTTVIISNSVPFELRDASGLLLTTIPAQTSLEITYDRSNHSVRAYSAAGAWVSANFMRFVPTDPLNGLFRIPNFDGWQTTLYENRFRGTLELNYYAPADNVWLIEELPLESYLRGLAETSNDSPYEFQKALAVAARTYAYFVHSIGGKYALFDLRPTDADQVYRAYGSETIRPNLVRAVEETRGLMVTYNNEVVITPYFSRSDGRTRSWQEVWCCKVKPWLVSVPAPHDAGRTLWGHGVGMSAHDAVGWADDGKAYNWILSYFYKDTVLQRIY